MFPRLTNKSFVKFTPNNKEHVFSFFINDARGYVCINESGSSILSLCNGIHSIEEITVILSEKYKEAYNIVENNVKEFLDPFIKNGFINDVNEPDLNEDILKGSLEVYYPNSICWEITNYCPLDCRHCYLPEKNKSSMSKTDIDQMFEIIDKAGLHQVQLTGGEALIHPNIEYIIDNLIDRGIITIISTSGFSFNTDTFRYLEKLKQVKGSKLRVSLDGNQYTHNYIRRNDHAYKNTVEFIKEAINHGIDCQVETCILNQSKQELEDFVDEIKKMGVRSIEFGRIYEFGNAKKNKLETIWTIAECLEMLKGLDNKYASNNFKINLPDIEKEYLKKNCGAGYNMIAVKYNFEVIPCNMLELKMGNLHESSLFDIMKKCGTEFQKIQSPNNETCSDCEKADECKNCIAIAYNMKSRGHECRWFHCFGV